MINYLTKIFFIKNYKLPDYLFNRSNKNKWYQLSSKEIEIFKMSPSGNNKNNSWLQMITVFTTLHYLNNKEH